MINRSTRKIPFEIVYNNPPNFVIDLTKLTLFKSPSTNKTTKEIQKMMEQVINHLSSAIQKYKDYGDKKRRAKKFDVRDMVMAHMGKG